MKVVHHICFHYLIKGNVHDFQTVEFVMIKVILIADYVHIFTNIVSLIMEVFMDKYI